MICLMTTNDCYTQQLILNEQPESNLFLNRENEVESNTLQVTRYHEERAKG